MAFDLISNEKVLLVRRRHWFKLFQDLLGFAFGFFLVVAITVFVSQIYREIFANFTEEILLGAGLTMQIFIVALFLAFTDYYLDIWVITNQRLIFVELTGLFNRKISSVSYHKVQDVSVEVKGVIPTLLDYGDLQVQTAGEFHEFIFKDVPKPYELKDKILSLHAGKSLISKL